MSKKNLKSMLNNLISDNIEEATLDLHNYLIDKMRQVSGLKEMKSSTDDQDDTKKMSYDKFEEMALEGDDGAEFIRKGNITTAIIFYAGRDVVFGTYNHDTGTATLDLI